jgi:DNA-binding NarL/FixJ family response regulator
MTRPRVVIAEDHVLVRDVIRDVLRSECDVLAVVEDGGAALEAVAEHHPDFLLLDISMPVLNGMAVARRVHKASPGVNIVFVTAQGDPAYVEAAFEAGARGYVVKGALLTELPAAIHEIQAGREYRSARILRARPPEPAAQKLA